MIGIAGASGAGKTTLARKLKNALGEKVTLLSQDSYYKDLSHLTREERARFNFDDPDSLDFELLEAHLKELKKGNSIDIPLYNFVTSTRESGTERIESKPTIIL
ncbi:MAG: AAA family ATPase, partial [Chlamydiia bacterium]|nr:AAA family ATPase [Chlamydiia bacterium]